MAGTAPNSPASPAPEPGADTGVTAPSLARGDEESVPYDDELVAVDLTARERGLLATGLLLWGGPARCTEAMAFAMGFDSVDDLLGQYDRLKGLLGRKKKPMSRTDWARTLLATEVCFASVIVGAGLAWGDDVSTLRALRIVQSKIATAGALTAWEGCRYPTDVCRVAARRDRGQYVTNNDELVEVALTTAESSLLVRGLGDLWGPAAPTDAMAIAIGFDSVEDLIDQYDRLKDLIQRRAALMSITDWIRTLLATEISTVSWVEGAGGEWGSAVDDASIQALRGLQDKLARMGALGRTRSAVDPADSAPTEAR